MTLFPYDTIRPEQDELIKDIQRALATKTCLIAHAPTGLGKTAAALAPALEFALHHNKTVFFLTSRHTQHHIAVETLRQIKQKHGIKFSITDVLGKQHMCAREDAAGLFSRQFHDYCRALRENEKCSYFLNFKKSGEPTESTKLVIATISSQPTHTEETVQIAKRQGVCPYEAAALASENAAVIIADYYYLFNPKVRESFLKRNKKSLADAIIIVDEAHNLPDRMREMLTAKLSTTMIERAVKEAEKWQEEKIVQFLHSLQAALETLASGANEKMVAKESFTDELEYDLELMYEKMSAIADSVRESEQQSSIGSIADFLLSWQEAEEGYAGIIKAAQSSRGPVITLAHHCLDPSLEIAPVIETAHATLLMSGTLTPTEMYKDVLGFPDSTVEREYENPMPKENRLALIVPGVTTKFSMRSPAQYQKIALVCAKAASSIPGNAAIFFPSYAIMNEVHQYLHEHISKKLFKEHPNMTKEEKHKLIKEFRTSYLTGGLLLAVIGGSFSEGIDLPGNALVGVLVVGLPLAQPDLPTKALINYYQQRYGRGWDYGYLFPAFTKALQSAGRCIRTETDRGVILFIDERYAQDNYYACFPKDLSPKMTAFYQEAIETFFKSPEKLSKNLA